MVNIPEDTQRLIDNLARPEHFAVMIQESPVVRANLSDEELTRLSTKMKLVRTTAQKLCANMLKGTLKHDRDDWSLREWFNYLRDDATDTLNYISLMEESVEKASSNSS